jgi:hypothetical protein
MTISSLNPPPVILMIRRKIAFWGTLSIKPKPGKLPYPHFSVVLSNSNLKLICIIACAFMTIGLTTLSQPVQGASYPSGASTLSPSGTLNYEEGVRIALNQSPVLTKSSLEIEVKRLDETDSRYGLFPTIDFRTYYYVNRPPGNTGAPYSLDFSTNYDYNPIASYFTLQAQKLATKVAILTHCKAISAGLNRLGQLFLDLDLIREQGFITKDKINLSREQLTYAENRLRVGTGTSLEVKEARQSLKSAQSELENHEKFFGFAAYPGTDSRSPECPSAGIGELRSGLSQLGANQEPLLRSQNNGDRL